MNAQGTHYTQALSTQFLPRPDRKESNLTFPADWRTKVHSCEKKKFLAYLHWHELWKQEKCSSLAPPRSKFDKTQ